MPSCCNSCGHWSFNSNDEPLCDLTYEYISQFDKKQDDCPLVEAIPKAEYEARLKSDMVAMLTEIQLEIEEKSIIDYDEDLYDGGECIISISEINEIIQQKINALKENKDGKR